METRPVCPNCGSAEIAQYCAHCGQRIGDVRMSVGRLFRDVLEDQFSLNSALPRTMRALFFKPGHLTREYFDLRIARYIPPFRLYLIATLLFFVVASFLAGRAEFRVDPEDRATLDSIRAAEAARQPRDTSGMRVRTSSSDDGVFGIHVTPGDTANWVDSVRVNLGFEPLNNAIKKQIRSLGRLPPEEALRRLSRSTLEQVPKVMFLLLPVYAFLLKLLYILKKRYYVEHFVFALHLHALMFFVFFLMIVTSRIPVVQGLLFAWVPIYTLIAMRRVYQQGWLVTFAKWAALGITYLLVLLGGLILALTAALLTV